jgi:hypothetical protein
VDLVDREVREVRVVPEDLAVPAPDQGGDPVVVAPLRIARHT